MARRAAFLASVRGLEGVRRRSDGFATRQFVRGSHFGDLDKPSLNALDEAQVSTTLDKNPSFNEKKRPRGSQISGCLDDLDQRTGFSC